MTKEPENLSIIDKGLNIEGKLNGKGEMIIRGRVTGELEGEKVVVAEDGYLKANANVVDMTINGAFDGTVRASHTLTVLTSGSCSGKVVCKYLVVEAGGKLDADVSYIDASHSGTEKIPL